MALDPHNPCERAAVVERSHFEAIARHLATPDADGHRGSETQIRNILVGHGCEEPWARVIARRALAEHERREEARP